MQGGAYVVLIIDRVETTLHIHSDTLSVSPCRSDETTTRLVSRAVARARAGDHDALQFLYVRYADDVYGYARTVVSGHNQALDVTRRVFARLEHVVDSYEERDVPFSVWIRSAARGVAADEVIW